MTNVLGDPLWCGFALFVLSAEGGVCVHVCTRVLTHALGSVDVSRGCDCGGLRLAAGLSLVSFYHCFLRWGLLFTLKLKG